jgi:hypothetical protein
MKFKTNFGSIANRPSDITKSLIKAQGFRSFIDIEYLPVRGSRVGDDVWNLSYSYHLAIDHRNKVILPAIHAITKQENDQIGLVPTTAYGDAKGGVKKKFFPAHGVVVAGDSNTAKGDYKKEDQASSRLAEAEENEFEYASFQKTIDDDELNRQRLKQFLLKNANDNDAKSVKLDQMRRVSIYGGFNDFDSTGQYHTTLERFVNDYKSGASDKPDQHPTEFELVSCIHQLIKIHEYLYINKITHGDMHMGNIKVIRNKSGVLLKTFDFGKAEVKSTTFFGRTERSPSRDDLKYLINKTAVSGRFETFKRNTWRSEDHIDQAKHYPLHKLCNLLSKKFIVEARRDPRDDFTVDGRISTYGNQLLENLNLIRADQALSSGDRDKAVRGMFCVFSNQIVTGALYGDPSPFG